MKFNSLSCLIAISLTVVDVQAFAPINPRLGSSQAATIISQNYGQETILHMAAGGKKKRRRRKKSTPEASSPSPSVEGSTTSSGDDMPTIDELKSIANFDPKNAGSGPSVPPTLDAAMIDSAASGAAPGAAENFSDLVELPDIRDALRTKALKKIELEEEEKRARPKINRRDKKAMLQLLEEQPFADADDSYFEEEEYGTVSALLAEGAKPFLGIPPGPLQVGHFIGALGIVLMAFVEYPGFPLTNLPTPLRGALQGGLATIYLVNAVLAIFAVFKAAERGQSSGLWAAKTFSVGGLAFDQLTQLPTLKEIEEVENRKGARAIKKKK